MPRRKPGRPKLKGRPKRTAVLSLRLTEEERELVDRAAGDIPPGIWARVAVVQAAREKTGKRKKGGRG